MNIQLIVDRRIAQRATAVKWRVIALYGGALAALSACAPVNVGPDGLPDWSAPGAAYPYERTAQAQDPWRLAEQAETAAPDQAATLWLQAIDELIAARELEAVLPLLERVQILPLPAHQRYQLALARAKLAIARGDNARAAELLRRLAVSPDSPGTDAAAEAFWLLADAEQALGRQTAALTALLRRDALPNLRDQVDGQQRIIALIHSLDAKTLARLRARPPASSIIGWLALGEILRGGTQAEQAAAVERWRRRYPRHPAERLLRAGDVGGDRYRQIALLLPMTSKYGEAARAFYEGFVAAHNRDSPDSRAEVRLYDIGEKPGLAAIYYRTARDDGADFIVGPLGQRAVDALLSAQTPRLPTLLIGALGANNSANNLYGISLAPEHDAAAAAERALVDGHRQAAVFRIDGKWGARVGDAFAAHWAELGGELAADIVLPADKRADYSKRIRALLGIDQSESRGNLLAAQVGAELELTPRRRADIDFLFLAMNAEQARLFTPQLRFFQAHDLALYATAAAYTGKPNPAKDADLDGIQFGDMRWMIDAARLPAPAAQYDIGLAEKLRDTIADELRETGELDTEDAGNLDSQIKLPAQDLNPRIATPYYHTALDRLYALGLTGYDLIPRLRTLRADPWRRHFGEAMVLSVQSNGNILRHLDWAKFQSGIPAPLAATR